MRICKVEAVASVPARMNRGTVGIFKEKEKKIEKKKRSEGIYIQTAKKIMTMTRATLMPVICRRPDAALPSLTTSSVESDLGKVVVSLPIR